jgi:hypothetical protein
MAAQSRAFSFQPNCCRGILAVAHMFRAAALQGIIINMGSVAAIEPMTQACACESVRPAGSAGCHCSQRQRLRLGSVAAA